MRAMFRDFGPGRKYELKDLIAAASAAAGHDQSGFFARHIQGAEALPVAEALDAFGFALVSNTQGEVFISAAQDPSTGRKAMKAPPKRSASAAFLSDLRDLKVGDRVVHLDHGIGRRQVPRLQREVHDRRLRDGQLDAPAQQRPEAADFRPQLVRSGWQGGDDIAALGVG